MRKALTRRQQCFVDEYLIDLNATRAAMRAGYSEKTAEQLGYQLLQKASVAHAIQESMDKRSQRTKITADKVLSELAKIGFSDIRKAVRWHSQATIAAIDSDEDMEALADEGALRFAVANQVELISSVEIDDDTAASIAEISQSSTGALKVKLYDKRAALVDIGRHLGMFTDKIEHSGQIGMPDITLGVMSK